MEQLLWYKNPAMKWQEGLPIGNGRVAAMIWGNDESDILSLNHEWLWRGVNRYRDNENVSEHLSEVRHLLQKGDFAEATDAANKWFAGKGGVSDQKSRVDSYQPAGELRFNIDDAKAYKRRDLDILSGVSQTERQTSAGMVTSVFLAHSGLNGIVCHWTGDAVFSGRLSFSRTLDEDSQETCEIKNNAITYRCTFKGGISFRVSVTVKTDGEISSAGNSMQIDGATGILAFVAVNPEIEGVKSAEEWPDALEAGWDTILSSHIKTFEKLINRFRIEISAEENNLPTDERVKNVKKGEKDAGLTVLMLNYGRYLLASSSFNCDLPANLQGKWNDSICPPWDCDYHFDINLEMNYWMAEPLNLAECTESLFSYIKSLIPHARKAAADLYNCQGVFFPLMSDAWGRSTPEACGWAVWIGAAPWIAQHLWQHYLYGGDIQFLRDTAYPFFKEVARFYEDYLVEDNKGILQIMPSQSPENRFVGGGDMPVSISVSSAMDVQLAYDALGYAANSAEILQTDLTEADKWHSMREKLPDFKIGADGRLLEWDREFEEIELGHRHLSPLYGLYPSTIFNCDERPEQYEAARKFLEFRLSNGGGHTGWSRSWTACLFARLGDAQRAYEHITALITDFTTGSLLDLHPPGIFQIDGNFGIAAAESELLGQYWAGKLHLLRALPKEWADGSVSGFRAPGGHTLNMKWLDCSLRELEVTIGFGKKLQISVPCGKDGCERQFEVSGNPGDTVHICF